MRRVIHNMFRSVFIVENGQGVTYVQNNVRMILSLISIMRTLRIDFYVETLASRLGNSTSTIKIIDLI